MARKPDLPCADCGKLMWSGTTSLPRGQARCLPCRRARPTANPPTQSRTAACLGCGAPARRLYCTSRCATIANNAKRGRYGQTMTGDRGRRADRDRAAAGLTEYQRKRLLAHWKRQGRSCAYCPSPASTVDHVVPLLRGGTNHEGNLAPACRPCNSGKGALLLVEWRSGLRLPPAVLPCSPVQRVRIKRIKPPGVATQTCLNICPNCSTLHQRPKFCSEYCGTRYLTRVSYRIKVGIPEDAPLWTRAS